MHVRHAHGPVAQLRAPRRDERRTPTRSRRAWSKSGKVRLGSHPDDYLLELYGERPAFLVTDPHTAGVYDTVYVDLDDDYDFSDEKPVTKGSPASYRDLNGDGYTDLSGGLALLHLGRQDDARSRAARRVRRTTAKPASGRDAGLDG